MRAHSLGPQHVGWANGSRDGGAGVCVGLLRGRHREWQRGVPGGGVARRDVEAPLECDQPVDEGPGSCVLGGTDLLLDGDQRGVLNISLSQALDEVKARSRERQDRCLLHVTAGQGVGHRIGAARLVFHGKVEAQQLAHPMVLGNGG